MMVSLIDLLLLLLFCFSKDGSYLNKINTQKKTIGFVKETIGKETLVNVPIFFELSLL